MQEYRNTGTRWQANCRLHDALLKASFQRKCNSEREFESYLSGRLDSCPEIFEQYQFISQFANDGIRVEPASAFGIANRPDMAIGTDVTAIELKYFSDSTGSFKTAIGQSVVYRIQYGWTFLVCVFGDQLRDRYEEIASGRDKATREICEELKNTFKIYTYFFPQSNKLTPGVPGHVAFFPEPSQPQGGEPNSTRED